MLRVTYSGREPLLSRSVPAFNPGPARHFTALRRLMLSDTAARHATGARHSLHAHYFYSDYDTFHHVTFGDMLFTH